MRKLTKTDQRLISLIRKLKKLSNSKKVNIWKAVAEELEKPTRKRREVNIWKINKYTEDSETIIVPGKVLGNGELDHKVNIAAFQFSEGAKAKIANHMLIEELMEKNPKGSKVRIIG